MQNLFCSAAMAVLALPQSTLQEELSSLLSAAPEARAAIVERILIGNPAGDVLADALAAGVAPAPDGDALEAGWSAWTATDTAGVSRPYQLYLPASVAAGEAPSALLIHMHGGVGRPEFGEGLGSPNATGYGSLLWPDLADEHGFALVCPQGREDTVWWSDSGVSHVAATLRDVRRRIEVPDRRIFGTGFSDGASGCYYLAMAAPGPFAGFIAMNGHPAVASSASGRQVYLRNLMTTRTIAAMTQEDSLYPSHSVLPHLTPAMAEGADLVLLSYPNMGHRPSYFDEQKGLFVRFLFETEREEAPERVRWLASETALGRASWLELLELGVGPDDAPALEDINVMTSPGRVRLGVSMEPGSTVASSVIEGSASAVAGLLVGDELTAFDGGALASTQDLRLALRQKTYGDEFTLSIRRDGKALDLQGVFPPFEPEPIYARSQSTSHMDCRVVVEDGSLRVEATARGVRRARIWLTREQAAAGTANVSVNGASSVLPVQRLSAEQVLERFAADGDGAGLRMHFLDLELP